MQEVSSIKFFRVITLILTMCFLSINNVSAQNNKITDAVYKDFFVIDGHTHDLVKRNGNVPKQSGIDRLEAASIDGVVLFFPLNRAPAESVIRQIQIDIDYVKQIAAQKNMNVKFVDKFTNHKNSSDSYSLQILFSGEIDGLFNGDLTRVDQLKDIGISLVVLDANDQDNIADEINNKKQFNEFGRKLIKKLNENNITIDISHLPEELQLEAIQVSTQPVIAGHANTMAIAENGRNISDKVMKELFNQGGVLLFTFCKSYLFGIDPDVNVDGIEKLLDHVDYVATKYGTDKIGIGTDYGGAGANSTKDMYDIECFGNIAERLLERDYSVEQVKQIMGGNILKFFSFEE